MRDSTAAAVRKNKEAHPGKYCAVKACLWALRSGPCPKHDTRPRCEACGSSSNEVSWNAEELEDITGQPIADPICCEVVL